MERYLRQTILPGFGTQGQQRLLASSALIVGLGGLGAPVASYLVSSGVGRIGLCDNDTVGITNLQRQILYTEHDLGKPKTLCAHRRLSAMSHDTVLDIIDDGLTVDNAATVIAAYDIVVDCTDNFATRRLIDSECRRLGKPWVHGSIDGLYGCVTVFNHRSGKRYADLYPDAETFADNRDRIIANLGPVPGVIGSIQALEALKLLSGCGDTLDGRILVLDLDKMIFSTIEF